MNVTSEKVAEGQVALTIEIEPERVEKAMDQAYHRLVVKTLVPGFRKGKAPRAMLERFLGQGALLEEALERLIPQVFTEAAKEENVTPFAEPRYEVVQVEPVVVKATVDLPPVVELGNYQEVRASLNIPEVTEDEVNGTIEKIRESMATWEPADRPVEMDDRITVDIRGSKDGEEFFTREGYPYTVRSDSLVPVPGFADYLIGIPKGGEKEFDISFPADHEDTTVAGHNFHFSVRVDEIKGKKLPPLDDELAKSAGEDLETFEEMRKKVQENLTSANERRAKEELVDKVVKDVVDSSTLEIPPSLVDREVHRIIEDEEERFQRQRFSLAQYLNMIGKKPEEYHDELFPVARDRVKRSLVLGKVAETEPIKVEPSEVDAEIDELLKEAGPQGEDYRKFFEMPEGRATIERTLLTRKTLHRLVEIATEGTVDYPEMAKASPPAAVAEEGTEASAGEAGQGSEPGGQEAEEAAQE